MIVKQFFSIVFLFFLLPKQHAEPAEWRRLSLDSLFAADFPVAPEYEAAEGVLRWKWDIPGAWGSIKRLAPQPGSEPMVTDGFRLQEYYDGLARGLHERLQGVLETDSVWRWGALQGRYLRWQVEQAAVVPVRWRREALLLETDQVTYLLESNCTGAACGEISARWIAGFQPIRSLPAGRQYMERAVQPARLPWLKPVAWLAFIVLLALLYKAFARRSGS